MATTDPLQALHAALSAPPESKEQADHLSGLREHLETQPAQIPILCSALMTIVSGAGDSLMRQWFLNLLHYAICRSSLSTDVRTNLASQSLDTLAGLLSDPNQRTLKVVVQTFATVYPLLFRSLCMNRHPRQQWDLLSHSKARILEFVSSGSVSAGVRLSALKFLQRALLVQTRVVSDPRLQNKADPNLSLCPSDHPFIYASALEEEGGRLMTQIVTLLFTSEDPDILSAILGSFGQLVKLRPAYIELIVGALSTWLPNKLHGQSASAVRSVEKGIRILLINISRNSQAAPHVQTINDVLVRVDQRMRQAQKEEEQRRIAEMNRKRGLPQLESSEELALKRPKLDHPDPYTTPSTSSVLANVDFRSLPTALVTDIVLGSLQVLSEPALQAAIQAYRARTRVQSAATAGTQSTENDAVSGADGTVTKIKQEPVDPLNMDIDEDEIEYEPDSLNLRLDDENDSGEQQGVSSPDLPLQLVNFVMPKPRSLSSEEKEATAQSSVLRIREMGEELAAVVDSGSSSYGPTNDIWMLLLVRMITRGTSNRNRKVEDLSDSEAAMDIQIQDNNPSDRARHTLCDYIIDDFSARVRLATFWMNEEWYNDNIRVARDPNWTRNYDIWLSKIANAYYQQFDSKDSKDKTFSRFLLDMPSIPGNVLALLRDLCLDPERMAVGFSTLRDLVALRPPLRSESMRILLELTTHPEKVTRGAAIITVKKWVPDVNPMDGLIREFALQMLRRLQTRPSPTGDDKEIGMEDGQLPQNELQRSAYLPDTLQLPADKAQVLQHVELLFALSVKVPEFLDEMFASYGLMDVSVQNAIQELITALIRSLGSSHGKLLTLLRTFPSGSESLVLRILTILTENGRPSAPLVALVKGLITERDLDARFLIPIIAEMDKADIIRHLPRIVSMLNGKQEEKNLVRSVFSAILTTPPTSSSNLPRVRQAELLTPAELMVTLHSLEKEVGLKSAMEAIGICFSMTDVFRYEVLAVVMQQIVDEPVLPTLFLRTVIQAVKTYKSLVPFVSGTLMSRLITKKIWTIPTLWEGFIRCAQAIAPASFPALLQLPKDQLRDLVEKQPSLRAGLRDHVIRRGGPGNRFLEVLGDEPDVNSPSPAHGGSVAAVASPSA